ncbi:MAG: hypothetical protein K2K48_02875, partial [Anaeroplasmataceae bacterium]|nr:hypothetical protein [Anaeroplasmataceae bacterium]
MKNLKIRIIKLSIIVVAFLAFLLYALNPANDNLSVSAAVATPPAAPSVTWSQVGLYQRAGGSSLATAYTTAGMSTTINTGYGNVVTTVDTTSDPNSITANATKTKSGTGVVTYTYVTWKSEVVIPAKTEFTVTYKPNIWLREYCSSSSGTGSGWLVFYDLGDTDVSDQITFNFNSPGTYPAGVTPYHLSVKRAGNVNKTPEITRTYSNNTLDDVTYTEYWGMNSGDSAGSSYKYTYNNTTTMTATSAFSKFLGPEKPSTSVQSKVYNGSLQDFLITDFNVNSLT